MISSARVPRFRSLPIRRTCGYPSKCSCNVDSALSATGFSSPAGSVSIAARIGLLERQMSYLELGAGNLRNSLFIQDSLQPSQITAVDQQSVIDRFPHAYKQFRKRGGVVSHRLPRRHYDVVIATYVLETICPPLAREQLVADLSQRLHKNSLLLLSVRGYGGVRGSKYISCSLSDGSISPRGAFVRAYSLSELRKMMAKHGVTVDWLKKYRVDTPENIHAIGRIRNN
jgi:hypothetical protein